MKYMGSKNRIAKYILPIMLKYRKENQYFVDLFCGGCNLIDKVQGKRIANDKNKYLIAMWKGLQKEIKYPERIDKELYSVARDVYRGRKVSIEHEMYMTDDLVGWIGFMGSYNGRFFDGGYSGHNVGKTKRDYISEQIKNTKSQIGLIKGVNFFSNDYSKFNHKESCIIYCDIPYQNTKKYDISKNFNYDKFWEWCRKTTKKGHQVFISEYNAPDDFRCVWKKGVTNSMNQTKTKKPIEKLFTIN